MEGVQEQKYMMNFYHNEHNHKFFNIAKNQVNDEENMYVSEDSTSSSEYSNISKESSSSLDLLDDASSSSSSCDGPLYGLSKLMDQLPIKRGLSKYYQGKSQSFTSLARVTSLEDLAKKETPYQRRLRACRSYGGGLNNNNNNSFKSFTQPKATISKKLSNKSSLSSLSRKNSFVISLPPLSHVQTTF
ncbi:hypothetical protein RND81_14G154300 [Saponaria officinalis]|uniref:Oxidative stress 3 n=1 Tax=Saponaria officinalis TaxID=3572 RepID=A0AAW1GQ48_SAPOF